MAVMKSASDQIHETKNDADISLNDWVNSFHSRDEMREIFFHMDQALKYVHQHGYCVKSFSPDEIKLLYGSPKYIQFSTLLEMPKNFSEQSEFIKEDIYRSAFLQIGIYSNYYWEPHFLKEHFDSISMFLPKMDVPYYRGIIERGASVYFCEYVVQRRERDLGELEKEIGDETTGVGKNKQLVKSNGLGIYDDSEEINDHDDLAFVHFLIYPTLLLVSATVLVFIAWLFSMI